MLTAHQHQSFSSNKKEKKQKKREHDRNQFKFGEHPSSSFRCGLPDTCKLPRRVDWLVVLLATQCSDLWTVNSRIRVTIYSCKQTNKQTNNIKHKIIKLENSKACKRCKRFNNFYLYCYYYYITLLHCLPFNGIAFIVSDFFPSLRLFLHIHFTDVLSLLSFFFMNTFALLVSRPHHRLRKLHFSNIFCWSREEAEWERAFFCYLPANDNRTIKISMQ